MRKDEKKRVRRKLAKTAGRRISLLVAAAVIFSTTYAMILPAVAIDEDTAVAEPGMEIGQVQPEYALACGYQAHVHTDDCYIEKVILDADGNPTGQKEKVLVCGKADFVVHVHNADCYDENGMLVCPLPEIYPHVHEESCWQTQKNLICTIPEHIHTEECYADIEVGTEKQLACGYNDGDVISPAVYSEPVYSEAVYNEAGELLSEPVLLEEAQLLQEEIVHHHTDECYIDVPVYERQLVCGMEEHTHSDACYTEEKVLICGQHELHIHTEECYEYGPNGESPIDMGWAWYVEENGQMILNGDPAHRTCGKLELLEHVHGDNCFVEVFRNEDASVPLAEPAAEEVPEAAGEVSEAAGEVSEGAGEVSEGEEVSESAEKVSETAEEVPESAAQQMTLYAATDTVEVTVTFKEGTFPEGTAMSVTDVVDDDTISSICGAAAGSSQDTRNIVKVQAADITFLDINGMPVEPAKPVRVVMTPVVKDDIAEGATVEVVHLTNDGQTEIIEQGSGMPAAAQSAEHEQGETLTIVPVAEQPQTQTPVHTPEEVVFEASSFSVYALVYTVHFEYEVDGEIYASASMPGAENMPLADVIRGIGIVDEAELEVFVSKIATVASTNEEVAAVGEDGSVRVLKDGEAQIVITMQDSAVFSIDVSAEGETEVTAENVAISTVDDLYLPAEAEAKLEVVEGAEAVSAVQQETGVEAEYTVFDISLENVEADEYNGFQVSLTLPENVLGKNFHLYHVHDGQVDELELIKESRELAGGTEIVSSVSFVTPSFSEFVLSYTVDFEFNGFSFSLIGNESILLSELFAALGIEESTANIAYVEFSDYALVSVEGTGDDYLLISRMPFQSEETLTITMTSGVIYAITVTDAQDWDITGTLENVEVTGADIDDEGKLIVVDGQYYTVNLTFRENDVTQFVNDGTTMVYSLPTGISVGNTSGTFTMDFGSLGKLENNTFRVENNTVYVNWNTSNQQMMEILKAADEAHFELSIEAMFDKHSDHIQWSAEISTNLQVNEPHEADVEKTGKYNAETDKIEYTVTVSSTGTTSGIKITDEITGTALTSDVNSVNDITVTIKHKDGTTSTVTPTGFTKSENGFVLNLPDMADGDVYTVNYTASVQYDKLGRNGQTTYLETNNGVVLEYNETPEPEYDNSYGYNINYSSFSKSSTNVGDVIEDSTGKYRLVDYRITANTEKKTSVSKIYDSIDNSSRNIMTMNGTGIIVTVTKEDGTTETHTITWGEDGANGKLTKTDDYSWIYYPPETDGKASYVIDYQTRVDMTNVNTTVNVKNNGGDDHSGSGSNTGITPDVDDTIELKKSVNSYSAEEVEWSIDFTVPKGGLNKAVLTDILPVSGRGDYYDFYKSVDIKGLLEGETYELTAKWKVWDQWDYAEQILPITDKPADTTDGAHPPIQTEIYITFYKGENEEGLKASSSSRVVTATITTENNQEWLKAAENDYWNYYLHKNTAKMGDIISEAEVSPAIKK